MPTFSHRDYFVKIYFATVFPSISFFDNPFVHSIYHSLELCEYIVIMYKGDNPIMHVAAEIFRTNKGYLSAIMGQELCRNVI